MILACVSILTRARLPLPSRLMVTLARCSRPVVAILARSRRQLCVLRSRISSVLNKR